MSKGSGRRPQQANDSTVQSNWDRIFKKPVHEPIPTGKVEVFGKSERGYTLYTASIYPDKYEAVNDNWILTCEVSRFSARWGHFSDSLDELQKSGCLTHEARETEGLEVSEDVIDAITQWAAKNGVSYATQYTPE